jgi:hypothetical protein
MASSASRMLMVSTLTWMQGWQHPAEQGRGSRLNRLGSLSSTYPAVYPHTLTNSIGRRPAMPEDLKAPSHTSRTPPPEGLVLPATRALTPEPEELEVPWSTDRRPGESMGDRLFLFMYSPQVSLDTLAFCKRTPGGGRGGMYSVSHPRSSCTVSAC